MNQRSNMRAIVLAAAAVVSAASWAPAGTITWDGGPDGSGTDWSNPLNWGGDVLPTSSDTAAFSNNGATGLSVTKTISLGAPQAVYQITIPDWSQAPSFTIGSSADISSGNTLTLARVYRGDNMSNTQTLAANVVLSQDSVWTVYKGYNGGLAVSGSISGDGKGVAAVVPNGGSLTFSGVNTYTGPTTLNSGTLNLSFASNSTDILSSSSSLVMGGGGLTLNGKASTVNSQTVNGLTLNPGASSLTIANSSTANPTSLTLGAITRNIGGTVNFAQPTNGVLGATNGYISSTGNDAGGILGGYATVGGNNWATNNGTNIVALGSYTNDTWDAANNTTVTTSGTIANDSTTHSLRFNAAAANTLTLGGTNTINSGGILVTSAVGNNATVITGGTLRGGAGGDLVVHQNNTSNRLTIASTIADNTSATALTKTGAGMLVVSSPATYSGGTYLNAGLLAFAGTNVVSSTTVNGNATVTVADITGLAVGQTVTGSNIPAATKIASVGTTTITLTKAATGGATSNLVYYIGGTTNQLNTAGDIVVSGGTLELGSSSASQTTSGAVRFLGGTVNNGTITKSGTDYDGQAGTVYTTLAGSVGLTKTGPGTLSLQGANTYTGDTKVLDGTLSANGSGTIKGNLIVGSPEGIAPATYTATGTPIVSSKTVTVYANGSVNFGTSAQNLSGGINILGGSVTGNQLYNSGTVTMTGGSFGGNTYAADFGFKINASPNTATVAANLSTSHSFNVDDGAADVDLAFTGKLVTAGKTMTKAGAGLMKVTGVNTHTGATTINGGTLWVSGAGSINSTSAINVNNASVFRYDSSVALTKMPTLNNTSTFIYDSPAKLGGDITIASGRTLGGSGALANVTVNGLLSPGNSPGVLTVDSLVLGSTATTTMEIAGDVLGSEYDSVSIINAAGLTYGGTLDVVALGGYEIAGAYSLFSFTGGYAGEFSAVNVNGYALTNAGGTWSGTQGVASYSFSDSTGTLTVVVPEPGTIGLIVGVACMGLARRQRKA